MTQLRVGQVQGGERGVFHRRVQAETRKSEPEQGKGKDWAQWEQTAGACSPGKKPPGEAHTGQARLQVHPLPGTAGWLRGLFLLTSSPASHSNHLGNCKAV